MRINYFSDLRISMHTVVTLTYVYTHERSCTNDFSKHHYPEEK